jgi:hypothetical protein
VQLIPHAGVLPLAQPPPRGVPGTASQLGGQIAPATTGLEHEQDPLQRGAVVDPRSPTRTACRRGRRDPRLDQLPQPILDQPLPLHPRHTGDDQRSVTEDHVATHLVLRPGTKYRRWPRAVAGQREATTIDSVGRSPRNRYRVFAPYLDSLALRHDPTRTMCNYDEASSSTP